MNRVLLFLRKYSGIFCLIAVMMSGAMASGQVTIFSENMGTPAANTAIAPYVAGTAPATFQRVLYVPLSSFPHYTVFYYDE